MRRDAWPSYQAPLRLLWLCLLLSVAMLAAGCAMVPAGAAHSSGSGLAAASTGTARPSPVLRDAPPPTAPPPTARPTAAPTRTRAPAPPSATAAPSPTPDPGAAPLTLEERRQTFREIWGTVREHYLYADFRGVDWQALGEEYGALIEAAPTKDAFYALMVEMVDRLSDQHSRFVPPAAVQTEDAVASGREVTVGIGVVTKPKADGAFIQLVFPDSPADRAGLRPRDRIIGVDGRSYAAADGDLEGPQDSTVRLTVVRSGAKPRDVVLARQEVQAHIVPTSRRFPGDIGYVVIPTLWVNDMDEQVSGALTDLVAAGHLNGLILDLRANTGGWGYVLSGILSHFVRGQVGIFFDRHRVRPLEVEPPAGPDLRSVPLVVLVDGDTASYAEVLAAILQRERGALVVGTATAGNTETIYPYTLADGSRLWIAQEGFRLQNGVNLEGVGVQPDSTVDVDWTRYSEDDDPQLLEALRLLHAGPK